jgi:hypothetical protein
MVHLSKAGMAAVAKVWKQVLEVEKVPLVAGDQDCACCWDRGKRKVEGDMIYNSLSEMARGAPSRKRQRRGDHMMEEVMWSAVEWGPRRKKIEHRFFDEKNSSSGSRSLGSGSKRFF